IVITVLVGACLAQGPQGRRHPQNDEQPQQNYQPAPQQQQQQYQDRPRSHESTTYIPIIRFDKEQGSDGSYKALWETGNNILAQEEGYLKDLGPDPDPDHKGELLHAQVQQGSYTYTAPDGQVITVTYTADESGFHATGDHLPTPPPVSPEVQKGLDLIYAGIKQQEQEQREYPQEQQSGRKQNQIPQDFNGPHRQQQ
ncbi:hypothetical protein ILUMI_08247, partial [Ignelater luminosus]